MPKTQTDTQNVLVTHAILCGLTPLIPVPFVDDLFLGVFKRSMARQLASAHGRTISDAQLKALLDSPSRGFVRGTLTNLALYPAKKLFRKVFFVLEWKRATDLIARSYYVGFLLDAALDENWIAQHGAARVRSAMDAVLARTNTSPLHHAAGGVVSGSKGVLKHLGRLLAGALPGTTPGSTPGAATAAKTANKSEIAQAAQKVEDEKDEQIGGLAAQLQSRVAGLPAEHFEQLRADFAAELERGTSSQTHSAS